MIQSNNNLSVLPWYLNAREQDYRKSYAFGDVYPLFCKINTILPFQIIRVHRTNEVKSVKLYKFGGEFVADITQDVIDTGLQIVSFANAGYDVIVYTGILPLSTNQLEGRYYLTLSDGVDEWISDVYTAVGNMDGYLKIEWHDLENLLFDGGQIVYKNPKFVNQLYLCTELGKPEYEFEEEGQERDGYFFPEKQLSTKKYRCTITAPEYLCDVMRLIRLSDFVRVTDQYGNIYDCDSFLITVKWQTQGNIASVEIEFKTSTVVKKLGVGYIRTKFGDFSDDYDNDYNKK